MTEVRFDEVHDAHPELTLPGEPPPEDAGAGTLQEDLVAQQSAHGALAVRQALTQRGVTESGTNGGVPLQRYVRYFVPSSGPVPWCAYFVSWCFDTTGDGNRRVPWGNPGYVGAVLAWARSTGRLVSVPEHGDMFGIGDDHMGLVAGSDPGRRVIWTIEGNYGDRVGQRNLGFDGLWFARL